MIRMQYPFNGKRFILNRNTGEIHDLLHETSECRIDEICPDHVRSYDSYERAEIAASINGIFHVNGCHYCNASRDTG